MRPQPKGPGENSSNRQLTTRKVTCLSQGEGRAYSTKTALLQLQRACDSLGTHSRVLWVGGGASDATFVLSSQGPHFEMLMILAYAPHSEKQEPTTQRGSHLCLCGPQVCLGSPEQS